MPPIPCCSLFDQPLSGFDGNCLLEFGIELFDQSLVVNGCNSPVLMSSGSIPNPGVGLLMLLLDHSVGCPDPESNGFIPILEVDSVDIPLDQPWFGCSSPVSMTGDLFPILVRV